MSEKSRFNFNFQEDGPTPPCGRKCPDRTAGCAVSCEKWKVYVAERNANYAKRMTEYTRKGPTDASVRKFNNRLIQEEYMKKQKRK
jgi:hypothetical protein